MADTPQQSPGLLANILAVAGFIILIVIIVWGAYHLLRLTGSGVTSLFSRFGAGDEITVTAPSGTMQSGKAFPLSWKYSPEENGTYAILYQCRAGFRFDATSPSGSTAQVPCGNAFTVGNNTSVTLTPVLSGTSTVEVPVSVVFIASATSSEERPQGSATIRVSAGNGSGPTSTPVNNLPATGTTSGSNSGGSNTQATGPADLSVRIIATGVVDMYGNFVQRAPFSPDEIAAVKFDIGNVGGTATGVWYFTATLPTNPAYTYQSPAQASLAPGAHIENILRFRPVMMGGGSVSVYVDPQGSVSEASESNNTASQWMMGGSWNYNQYPYSAPFVY
jgi:hypothetical protein